MEKRFSSFEQIDAQLEMLRIQRQLSLARLKSQFGEEPGEILRSGWKYAILPSLKNMAIDWALDQLGRLRKTLRLESHQYR